MTNPHPSSPPHVLLVEDNVIALHFIETIAQQAGLQFSSVMDGESALKLAKSKDFDLIITDIGLPGMSGHELTTAIRQWEDEQGKPNVPIIGLTAYPLNQVKKDAKPRGMVDILQKPINLRIVKHLVEQWIPNTPGSVDNSLAWIEKPR